MRPIPRRFLPSSMTVRVPVESEHPGRFADPVAVGHVRYERYRPLYPLANQIVPGGHVLTDGTRGRIYMDAENSEGAFEIPEGSLVSIDGADEVSVSRVDALAGADGRIHHWEIEVA